MSLPIIQEHELVDIQKPAQYLGGEVGSVTKDDASVKIHTCLAFPDTYEVGMSHTGYQILYDLLNKVDHIWAERVYVPLPDMEELLRSKKAPLTSLEAKRALKDFDIVGFSLQYELCMSGILTILDLGNIPLLSSERGEDDPIIIGGGPVAYHPEPFADFFDAFLIGDGEELVPEFHNTFLSLKEKNVSRHTMLRELSRIQGVYVPSFFTPEYTASGNFVKLKPHYEDYTGVKRRIIPTLENASYPTAPLVPNIRAVHDRLSVEVMRGCVRGCRFCQAGYLYRPQRERSPEDIRDIVKESLKNTGYEELSLLSLSTADYCSILPLLKVLKEKFASDDNLAISFPSTRVDALTPELLQEVQPIRRSGFTMAPEAGTQRLRDVINKGVTDEQIIATCTNVFNLGWSSVKLYFMIGLPTETDEDLQGIIDIASRVKKIAGRHNTVTVSVSTHVPKPDTPFQWAEQITEGETLRKQQFLARELKFRRITFRYHDARSSFLEGVFARGDRQLGEVILRAYKKGVRLDGWAEELKFELWDEAFEEAGIDPHHYLHARDTVSVLPWEHIDCDIPKRYFLKEWQRATASRTTPDCLTATCSTCGACDYDAVRNVLFERTRSQSRLQIVNPPWEEIIERRASGENVILTRDSHRQPEATASQEQDGTYALKEYLKTEVETKRASLERPHLDTVQILRIQYSKTGDMRYAAHLELKDMFFRAARKAELPIVFSKGFHPKPKFAFGPPLQLGVESLCEFVDVSFSSVISGDECQERLNATLPSGLRIEGTAAISSKERSIQASIAKQNYHAVLLTEDVFQLTSWEDKTITRKTKKGKIKTLNLCDFVSEVSEYQGKISFAIKTLEEGNSLKPYEVITALTDIPYNLFRIQKTEAVFQAEGLRSSSTFSAESIDIVYSTAPQ